MYKKIGDYGIIGNLQSVALVGKDGSIDWLCFPNIDSPSVFAALLDADDGGFFSITPEGEWDSVSPTARTPTSWWEASAPGAADTPSPTS